MFHELSHCLLGLDHVDNYKNYMYYSVIHIPDEDLNNQLIQDIQRLCKKN